MFLPWPCWEEGLGNKETLPQNNDRFSSVTLGPVGGTDETRHGLWRRTSLVLDPSHQEARDLEADMRTHLDLQALQRGSGKGADHWAFALSLGSSSTHSFILSVRVSVALLGCHST